MSSETILRDDIDGTVAVETVRFGLDGHQYVVDLSAENAAHLRAVFQKYLDRARRITTTGRVLRPRIHQRPRRPDSQEVRHWAREHGLRVAERGAIPVSVYAAFDAAHEPQPEKPKARARARTRGTAAQQRGDRAKLKVSP